MHRIGSLILTAVLIACCGSERTIVHRDVGRDVRAEARVEAIQRGGVPAPGILARDLRAGTFPGSTWSKVVDPSTLGWSMERLDDAREFSERAGCSAVFIVQDGAVVASWGDVTHPYNLRSVRKALLGSLYGEAVASNKIALDATLADLGIDEKTPLTAGEKTAKVADLLTSSSGIMLPAAYETGDAKPARGTVPRGKFVYNNWDFNALGTIYERAAKRSLFDAFDTEIARPIGMSDFDRIANTEYRQEDVSQHRAYLFSLSARDLARFGLLYLRDGAWNGTQVVPAQWVRESTQPRRTTPRKGQSYGYLWWVRDDGSFDSTGNGGQLLHVDPRRKLVVVLVTNTNVLWLKRAMHLDVDNREREALLQKILAAAPGVTADAASSSSKRAR